MRAAQRLKSERAISCNDRCGRNGSNSPTRFAGQKQGRTVLFCSLEVCKTFFSAVTRPIATLHKHADLCGTQEAKSLVDKMRAVLGYFTTWNNLDIVRIVAYLNRALGFDVVACWSEFESEHNAWQQCVFPHC